MMALLFFGLATRTLEADSILRKADREYHAALVEGKMVWVEIEWDQIFSNFFGESVSGQKV